MSSSTVLARKWRPKNFEQLTGQTHVIQALSNALSQQRLHHAYLFTGTRGVGKTTIARIFAKSLNCYQGISAQPCGVCDACLEIDSGRFIDLIELDAASNTQVDSMRELLENALYAPTSGRFKVYIIDEVHMLSKSAFNAMLKTLEEPPEHVKFILATTDPQKIPVTVLSRCLQFNLKQLSPNLIVDRLQYVLAQEAIEYEVSALKLVAKAAQGSMRDALSLMDQAIAFSDNKVEQQTVSQMLGNVDRDYLFKLLHLIQQQAGAELLQQADLMLSRSIDFDGALQELASLLHRVALAQTVPQAIAEDDVDRESILSLAQLFTAEDLQLYYQIAIHGRKELPLAPDEYAGFTMALLRMLAFAPQELKVSAAVTVPRVVAGSAKKQSESVASPLAARQEQSSVPSAQSPVLDGADWPSLLECLALQGMALQLAKHCVLIEREADKLVLQLAPEQKHLQTRIATEKIQAALNQYFARHIQFKIVLGSSDVATPAVLEQQSKEVRQQQAEQAINQDPFVQAVRHEMAADIVPDSIKPI